MHLTPPSTAENRDVVENLVRWLSLQPATTVLVYLSMAGELAAEQVVPRSPQHRFATTRTPAKGPLTIHDFDAPRERHRFGYEQPSEESSVLDGREIGIVLAPGLAFDGQGNRLGWGKGYYDQLLASLKAEVVGVTLDRRMAKVVPHEAHDVRVDWLATESGVVLAIQPADADQ